MDKITILFQSTFHTTGILFIHFKLQINWKNCQIFVVSLENLNFYLKNLEINRKGPFIYNVSTGLGGFRNWPFLLNNSTQKVGGLETPQKYVYVIFERSLTYHKFWFFEEISDKRYSNSLGIVYFKIHQD